ncbi:phage antirepressor [Nocardiopsis sp. NPDC049922]|uniref:phage antirepressor n=1 Tax=Nocardiopsis sp. NPDC049922 TaxID=3155157 RepID=UPI0033CB406D
MSTEIEIFNNDDFGEVRTFLINGAPWFVASDVCEILGLSDFRTSLRKLDEDERHTMPVTDALGRKQDTYVVNEAGLYSLILRSRKPVAKAFKRWVTHEVIPSIRKTGSYGAPQVPGTFAEALELAAVQQRELEAATEKVKELTPKATAWIELADSKGDYSVREAAQIISRSGYPIGRDRLFGLLRSIGWIDRKNEPYQKHVDNGRLVRKVKTRTAKSGERVTYPQVRINPKGCEDLVKIIEESH